VTDLHHFPLVQKRSCLTDPALRHLHTVTGQLLYQLLLVVLDLSFRLCELLPLFLFVLIHFPLFFQLCCTVRIVLQIQIFHQLTVVHIADLDFILQLDDLVDGLLHPLQFPSCIHVPDADIGDGYSSCTYCQKKSHIDIHFKSILQDHQHDHTDDQCRKENDSHAPLVVHQILQLISPVFVGMSFSVQSVQILPYQIAVFLAVPNLLNAFFNLVLSFADRIEVRIPHTVLLFPVSAAFLFQPGQLAGHPVDLFSLLCWQGLNLIRIRQIRSHQRILSRQEVDLLGSLCDLLQAIYNVTFSLVFLIKIHTVAGIDQLFPVLFLLYRFFFLK